MAKAIAKNIRMSPRKLRRVIDVVRGKRTGDAQTVLKFMPYAASRVIEKVLKSAIANAKENENLNPADLKITKAYIDQSTTLKRWRAMSRGRGFPILKRTSHVTIEVGIGLDLGNNQITETPKQIKKRIKIESHVHGPECDHGDEHVNDHSAEHKHGKEKESKSKGKTKKEKDIKAEKTKEKKTAKNKKGKEGE